MILPPSPPARPHLHISMVAEVCRQVLAMLQKLQEEVNGRQATVDDLKRLAEKLIEDYSDDDTHNTRTQLERLSNRWSCLLNRLARLP